MEEDQEDQSALSMQAGSRIRYSTMSQSSAACGCQRIEPPWAGGVIRRRAGYHNWTAVPFTADNAFGDKRLELVAFGPSSTT